MASKETIERDEKLEKDSLEKSAAKKAGGASPPPESEGKRLVIPKDLHDLRSVGNAEPVPPGNAETQGERLVIPEDLHDLRGVGNAEPVPPGKAGIGVALAVVGVLGMIPTVKQFVAQLWHKDYGAAAETGAWTAASFYPPTMPLVGAKVVAHEFKEHREGITKRGNAVGEALDPGVWFFGVRTPIGGFYAASYAVAESSARGIVSIGKGIGEGAALVWKYAIPHGQSTPYPIRYYR